MVPVKVDFNAVKTGTIIWTGLMDLEPAIDSIGLRDLWAESAYVEGWRMQLTMNRYGDKLGLHKYDPLITFFTSGGRGAGELARLSRELLGNALVDTMETQIRNAFIGLPFRFFVGGGTGFSAIGDTDLIDPDLAMDVQLNFAYHEVVDPNSPGGLTAVAYGSPGQIYGMQQRSDWVSRRQYTSEGYRQLLRYEVGEWKGLRWINHPRNTLYNCGAITAQAPVTAAITAGDGAPDPTSTKVLGTYEMGQRAGSQTHYIQLGTFSTGSISDLVVGDKISIHTRKADGATAPYDIVGAPYPTDGTKVERTIVSIDTGNARITLDQPILRDYSTAAVNDCSAGEYAFVTKGRHIHMSVIVAAPGAVVGGFAQPPMLHFPPPIDDFESLYRITWDGYYDYGLFRTQAAAVIYSAGYVMSGEAHKSLGSS